MAGKQAGWLGSGDCDTCCHKKGERSEPRAEDAGGTAGPKPETRRGSGRKGKCRDKCRAFDAQQARRITKWLLMQHDRKQRELWGMDTQEK